MAHDTLGGCMWNSLQIFFCSIGIGIDIIEFIQGNHCGLQYTIIKYALSRTTHLWSSAKLGFCIRPTGWYVSFLSLFSLTALLWRHNGCHGVSNHQSRDCLLNRLFRHRWKKTSKLCVTGLCAGNSPVTGEFPAQRASNAENVFIWWRHHVTTVGTGRLKQRLKQSAMLCRLRYVEQH